MSPDSQPDNEQKLDRLLSGFTANRLKTPKVPFLYRIALTGVAIGMILLPLVYVSLIVLLAWWTIGKALDPPAAWELWSLIKYGVIVVAGPIACFFMIKPLFAKPFTSQSPIRLKDDEEPLVQAFVRKIAETVGAPSPESIRVDCNVNASASYEGGFRGMLQNRLKLVIGLPLVAGLSLRSFGGVLAHEFGHFSQTAGMRMTYLIRRVNNWFYRVVYERDTWDMRLYESLDNEKGVKALIGYAALFIITVNRWILWILMVIGHGISCFALRQMEFDADAYEIQFAGSDVFDKTTRRICVLNAGSSQALRLIEENWQEQRLAEDFATLARTQADGLSKRVLDAIEESLEDATTSAFATHPSDIDRIRHAVEAGEQGIFHLEEPANTLFEQFRRLSRKATMNFYRNDLGLTCEDSNLVANKIIYREGKARRNEAEACERYFAGRLTVLRPLWISPEEFEEFREDRSFSAEDLAHSMADMNVEMAAAAEAFDEFDEADERYVLALQARELLMAGYRVEADRFGLKRGDLGEAQKTRDDAQIQRNQAIVKLNAFDLAAKHRLMTGLALLKQREKENSKGGPDDGYLGKECDKFIRVLGQFGRLRDDLHQLRESWAAQAALMNTLSPDGASESVIERLHHNTMEAGPLHGTILDVLSGEPYPFKHSMGAVTVSTYVEHWEDEGKDGSLRAFATSERMVDRLFSLYFRVIGRLTILAETVEMGEWIEAEL